MNYKENDTITLESGKSYYVINTLELDNNKYVYLCSVDNPDDPDLLILKDKLKENKHCLVNLDSEEEFTKVITEIGKKYN